MRTKIAICLMILISASTFVFGQGKEDPFDYERFKADKIAFITEAINLTPAEAEKFWPVYNEFEKKKWEIMSSRRDLENSLQNNFKEMTDKEYTELTKKLASFPKVDGDLNLEYNEKFLKILSPRKVVKLYIAEVNFRGSLLRKYRNNGHERGN